ncbi:MAG: DEAD/DEAH box helicase [candidate division Zixibacteria bacterium]|nr:DEAD/DEAH box helicase [candidate division Zixibacteria bacterium]
MSDNEFSIEPEESLPPIAVEELPERMREATAGVGWQDLMPVQARTIPYVMAGRDIMVQARTGSGKTGAFVLPILERLDPNLAACQALILVPTRELASQVTREAENLGRLAGVRTASLYGGVRYGPQFKALEKGAHIVVGTPGRVLDHLLRKTLKLDDLDVLVFDEADRMLSMGFYPDMKQVQTYLPRRKINTFMFSATFPAHVKGLARQFMQKPGFLSLSRDHVHVTDTDHVFYVVPGMEKDRSLTRIIEVENPSSAIIFCNTKSQVAYVSTVLKRFGYDADELSADLRQNAREKVMDKVREGKLRYLVATDVAARGIDIPEISHVFQYDPPEDPEVYIHRAGRTGRAGAAGVAISLVAGNEQATLKKISRRFDIDMEERPLPSQQDVETIVSQRVIALLEARLRDRDTLRLERMQRFVPLARALAQLEEESAIVAMLLDDYYQQTLHLEAENPVQPTRSVAVREKDARSDRGRQEGGAGRKRGRPPRRRK